MTFTLTEKALIAIASLFISFHAGQISDQPQQNSFCPASSPEETSVVPK
jgi:hypothetical protein